MQWRGSLCLGVTGLRALAAAACTPQSVVSACDFVCRDESHLVYMNNAFERDPALYRLYWSAQQYREEGRQVGLAFSREDMERASRDGGFLGVRRHMPGENPVVSLGVPAGVEVRCFLADGE